MGNGVNLNQLNNYPQYPYAQNPYAGNSPVNSANIQTENINQTAEKKDSTTWPEFFGLSGGVLAGIMGLSKLLNITVNPNSANYKDSRLYKSIKWLDESKLGKIINWPFQKIGNGFNAVKQRTAQSALANNPHIKQITSAFGEGAKSTFSVQEHLLTKLTSRLKKISAAPEVKKELEALLAQAKGANKEIAGTALKTLLEHAGTSGDKKVLSLVGSLKLLENVPKSKLLQPLSKLLAKSGLYLGHLGLFNGIFGALALTSTVKDTYYAPKEEKAGTFMHGIANNFGWLATLPVGMWAAKGIANFKNLGTLKELPWLMKPLKVLGEIVGLGSKNGQRIMTFSKAIKAAGFLSKATSLLAAFGGPAGIALRLALGWLIIPAILSKPIEKLTTAIFGKSDYLKNKPDSMQSLNKWVMGKMGVPIEEEKPKLSEHNPAQLQAQTDKIKEFLAQNEAKFAGNNIPQNSMPIQNFLNQTKPSQNQLSANVKESGNTYIPSPYPDSALQKEKQAKINEVLAKADLAIQKNDEFLKKGTSS